MTDSPIPARIYPTISFADAALITEWVVMVVMIFSVLVRSLSKVTKTRKVTADDCLIMISMLFSIGQSIATTTEIQHGPGGPKVFSATLFQKSAYVAELLYIPTMAISKLSTGWLLYQITVDINHQWMITVLMVLVTLWAIPAEFVAAFQCSSPNFSMILSSNCINQTALWTYFGVFSIFLDIGIMLLPLVILRGSQMSLKRKGVVIGAFWSRLCLVAATIARLIYINRFSNNLTRQHDLMALIISTQVEQNLSVISATIPYLKPFFESLESGMMRNDDAGRSAQYSRDRSNRYATRSILRRTKNSSQIRKGIEESSSTSLRKDVHQGDGIVVRTEISGINRETPLDERGSESNDQMMIRNTRDWTVQ